MNVPMNSQINVPINSQKFTNVPMKQPGKKCTNEQPINLPMKESNNYQIS